MIGGDLFLEIPRNHLVSHALKINTIMAIFRSSINWFDEIAVVKISHSDGDMIFILAFRTYLVCYEYQWLY